MRPIKASFIIPFHASVCSELAPHSTIRKPHHTTISVAPTAIMVVSMGIMLLIRLGILSIPLPLDAFAFSLQEGKKSFTSTIKLSLAISPVKAKAGTVIIHMKRI